MYVTSEAKLLCNLCNNQVLDSNVHVTDINVKQHSPMLGIRMRQHSNIIIASVDEGFHDYYSAKRRVYPALSLGEISTLYYLLHNEEVILVSHDGTPIHTCACKEKARVMGFDEFMSRMTTDERKLKIYKLLKSAA